METFLSRYRNISILLLLLVGQLLLLAWQVKAGDDARLLRVWAVTAVTPLARATEWLRGGVGGFFSGYVALRDAREINGQLRDEIGKLRLANQYLKAELEMAERARALQMFRTQTPSKTLAGRVIATGTGLNSRVVFADRGSVDGVKKGMAVILPQGIVGKVIAAYPTASQVMLATSNGFAAGVISQKHRVRGTLKGAGSSLCPVDHIDNEDNVEVGEWFYTTGDDRIFPRGLPVGVVKSVKEGREGKEVLLEPSGLRGGVDEILIVVEGVHGLIPDPPLETSNEIQILPPPPPSEIAPEETVAPAASGMTTDADRLRERYRRIGESQGHTFGASPGRPPDFNRAPPPQPPASAAPATTQGEAGTSPPAAGPATETTKQPPAGGASKQPASKGTVPVPKSPATPAGTATQKQ